MPFLQNRTSSSTASAGTIFGFLTLRYRLAVPFGEYRGAVQEALHEYSIGSRPWSVAICSEMGARRPANPRRYQGNPRIYQTRIPPTVAHGACRRGCAALARANRDT